MTTPILLAWSGGKDCLLALQKLLADPRWRVAGLLTTINRDYRRVAMHGVRLEVLHAQVTALELPLIEVMLDWPGSNEAYEAAHSQALIEARMRWPGIRHCAFGDLFLEDVRDYRVRQLGRDDWHAVFPLWGEEERQRLKDVLNPLIGESPLGYIVRTNAEGQSADSLAFDVTYLGKVWRVVQENIAKAKMGERVYEELSLPLRSLRDMLDDDIEKVRIDSRATFDKVVKFVHKFMPSLDDRIEHYDGERPIFDLYGVEDEIQRALKKEVPLKSGGYLIVDQTEAMTTIDVNTGAYLGTRNLEETVYRTNLEAAQAASRQLRLRNLGGIIIIDFIDMNDEEHKRQVLRMLNKGLARDHAKTTVYPLSALGLVEMTRKRTTESLARQLCEPCAVCNGRGVLKTAETVTYEIFREITRAVRQFNAEQLLVMANPTVVNRILEEESSAVAELEEFISKSIRFQAEEHYSQEQFDVVLL